MEDFKPCLKKQMLVHYREPVNKDGFPESIYTLEGNLEAIAGRDFVIKGIKGELYPIRKDIFAQTYSTDFNLIDIPMNSWSGARLMAGKKHSTWRSKIYGKKGDIFQHLNKRFRLAHEPFQVPLGVVIHYLYKLEGAESPDELTRVLCSIKRCKAEQLDMKELGWLHVFAEVG